MNSEVYRRGPEYAPATLPSTGLNTALAAGFTTVDIGVGYRVDRYEVRLDGRNLGDARDAVSESELGDAQYYRMPARRLDVTFGLRF